MDIKNWKLLGAGITVAILTSCGDRKEKTQQDNEAKAQTEKIMDSQKIISELSSDGISVLKAGKEGKPDSLLHSVEKEGNVYSNPEYKATDDVSKALGIEQLSYEITEVKINKKDAMRIFGRVYGDINTGDAFKVNGYNFVVIDGNAQNSIKMRTNYRYRDFEHENHNTSGWTDVSEFDYKADNKDEKSSGKWTVTSRKEEYSIHTERAVYKDEKFGYLPRETVSTGDWNSVEKEGEFVEIPLEVLDNKLVVFIKGEKYDFDFGDLSKANIVRDAKLPKKPKAPKRKIGEALIRTLAGGKKKNR